MKIKHKDLKKLILEKLNINEGVFNIDKDVDNLYNLYFKDDIDEFNKTKVLNNNLFKRFELTTNDLSSDVCVKANEINPCTILINYGLNYYKPSKNIISISVSREATNLIDFVGGNINDTISELTPQSFKMIKQEFSEEKMKGSIRHELIHWLDDSLNNKHIDKKLNRAMELYKPMNKTINTHYLEINAQIGNIQELKRKYSNYWDIMSFDDMIKLSPSLNNILNNLPKSKLDKWIKSLKKRMYREGLLGKKMYNLNKLNEEKIINLIKEKLNTPTFSGYKLQGRIKFKGLDISIENRKGSIRKWVDGDGNEGKTKMLYPYGYIRNTIGNDGDHVDCYIGNNKESDKVFIIHQMEPKTNKFDEDKVMLGFDNKTDAKEAYLKHYSSKDFFGSMDEMSIEDFKSKVLGKVNKKIK